MLLNVTAPGPAPSTGRSLTPGVSDPEPEKPAFLMMSWERSVILGNTRPASRLEGTPPGDSGSPRPDTHGSILGRFRSGQEAQWPHRAPPLTLRGPDAPSPATQRSPSGLSPHTSCSSTCSGPGALRLCG